MTRPLRLEYPGALWHVTNRGVERRDIYVEDHDRNHFLSLLRAAVLDHQWQLCAWVLMSNHYHLLFHTPHTNLSRGMKDLDGSYASWFNARHQRVGHLFQGRFKSHLVDSDSYLLEVARYIVLNPVRAQMVTTPGEWRWSSYRAMAGLAAVPDWLDPAPILDRLNATDWNDATSSYRELVAAGIGRTTSPWENLVAQAFLGGEDFLRSVEERVRERTTCGEHRRDQRTFRMLTIERIKETLATEWPPPSGSDTRALFVLLAERHTSATRAQIGRHLGITGQGIGYLIRVSKDRMHENPPFAALLDAAERRL